MSLAGDFLRSHMCRLLQPGTSRSKTLAASSHRGTGIQDRPVPPVACLTQLHGLEWTSMVQLLVLYSKRGHEPSIQRSDVAVRVPNELTGSLRHSTRFRVAKLRAVAKPFRCGDIDEAASVRTPSKGSAICWRLSPAGA